MGQYEIEPAPGGTLEAAPSTTVASTNERTVVAALRGEMDGYWATMQQFQQMEPDEVMLRLSAMSARAGEIRARIIRSDSRLANKFRTTEIDPFIEECDRQFKLHSRVLSMRELDWKMAGGQT